MDLLDKFFTKNYKRLQVNIFLIALLVILIANLIGYYFLAKTAINVVFDIILTIILTIGFICLTFLIIRKKEKQLKDQVDQLTDSYKYIGQINRKIDSLLEIDISNLDHSKGYSMENSSHKIFSNLCNILNAKAGLLTIHYQNNNFKIFEALNKQDEIKTQLEKVAQKHYDKFYSSFIQDHQQYFDSLGLPEKFLKENKIISKPVYMHDQELGNIILAFDKNEEIEERDLNIIRVFSFYIALNATFTPDFKLNSKN